MIDLEIISMDDFEIFKAELEKAGIYKKFPKDHILRAIQRNLQKEKKRKEKEDDLKKDQKRKEDDLKKDRKRKHDDFLSDYKKKLIENNDFTTVIKIQILENDNDPIKKLELLKLEDKKIDKTKNSKIPYFHF